MLYAICMLQCCQLMFLADKLRFAAAKCIIIKLAVKYSITNMYTKLLNTMFLLIISA